MWLDLTMKSATCDVLFIYQIWPSAVSQENNSGLRPARSDVLSQSRGAESRVSKKKVSVFRKMDQYNQYIDRVAR